MATIQDQINLFVANGKILNDTLAKYYSTTVKNERQKEAKTTPRLISSSFTKNFQTSIVPLYKSSTPLNSAKSTITSNSLLEQYTTNPGAYQYQQIQATRLSDAKWMTAFSMWNYQLPVILTLAQVNQGQTGQAINSFNQWATTYLGKYLNG